MCWNACITRIRLVIHLAFLHEIQPGKFVLKLALWVALCLRNAKSREARLKLNTIYIFEPLWYTNILLQMMVS